MAKYEKHPRIEKKFQCVECTYGHKTGRSRQAVSKHYDSKHKEVEETLPEVEKTPEEEKVEEVEVKIESNVEPEFTEPEWLKIESDFEDVTGEVGSIPSPVKSVLRGLQGAVEKSEKSVIEMKQFFKHQAKMVRFFLAGVIDPLISWWGKGVTANPEYKIQRSDDEWEMTEEITAQWMEYRGVSVPLNPDMLMVGCMGALYAPPIINIRKQADPNRPRWKPFGFFQRWRQRRAVRKALSENPHNDAEATYGIDS